MIEFKPLTKYTTINHNSPMTQIIRGENVHTVEGCWEAISLMDLTKIYSIQINQNLDDDYDFIVVYETEGDSPLGV